MKTPPRPTLPPCDRCGIPYDLRNTRAHRAARERERLARTWMDTHHL